MNSHLQYLPVLLVVWLILLFPALDALLTNRLKQDCDSKRRIRYYALIVVSLWASVALAVLCLGWNSILTAGSAIADAKSSLGTPVGQVLIGILALALLYVSVQPYLRSLRNPKVFASYKRITDQSTFGFLFPSSVLELQWFAVVSVTAGICEEILFRSFLVSYLHSRPFHLGLPVALVAAAISFGLNHGYQGLSGIIRTSLIGILLSLLYLSTGSLWLVIVVHALMDLQVVIMLRPSICLEPHPHAHSPRIAAKE